MTILLDKDTVAALEPPAEGEGDDFYWDSELGRFAVRVAPTGRKTFLISYTSPTSFKARRHTIGAFTPGPWTAVKARARAKQLLKAVDEGEDPQGTKVAQRTAPTVSDLADRYIRDHLPRKSPKSQRDDARMIEVEILPRLGDRRVADVHLGDIEALRDGIASRINPRTGKGRTVKANHVLALVSKMFSLSLKPLAGEDIPWRDRAQGNPVQGCERYSEEAVERFFSQAEIAALSDSLSLRGTTPAVNAIRLLMLTGARPGEVLAAQWPEFDHDPGYWIRPSSHTKARRVLRVPLSPGAIELINQVRKARSKSPRAKNSPFVFPGQRAGEPIQQLRSTWDFLSGHASVSLWKASIDPKVAKLVSDLEAGLKRRPLASECKAAAAHLGLDLPPYLTEGRLYDLRHTFASVGAGRGMSLQIIGKLLGHTVAKTTMRYSHLSDHALQAATDMIGSDIAGAGKAGAKVRRLRGA